MKQKKHGWILLGAGAALVIILLLIGLIFTANPDKRTIRRNSWINRGEDITVALDFSGSVADLYVIAGDTVIRYCGSFTITYTGLYITDNSRKGDHSGEVFSAGYTLDGDTLSVSFNVSGGAGTATFTLTQTSQEEYDRLIASVS